MADVPGAALLLVFVQADANARALTENAVNSTTNVAERAHAAGVPGPTA